MNGYYDFVIQAGKFETFLTLESRTWVLFAGAAARGAIAAVVLGGALAPLSAAGAAVIPSGFVPYGLGVPTGGDQVP